MIDSFKDTTPIRADIADTFRSVIETRMDIELMGSGAGLYEFAKANTQMKIEGPFDPVFFEFFKGLQYILFRHIPTTAKHIICTFTVGNAIANDVLKLSPRRADNIKLALLLHDIGKICTPVNILEKPAKLTMGE
jgi:response regulator RpfG family c-di-GMP phosphodiesterase